MNEKVEKYLVLVDKGVEEAEVAKAIATVGERNLAVEVNILEYEQIVDADKNQEVVDLLAKSEKFVVVNKIDENCFGYLTDEMYGVILGLQTHQDKKFYYRHHVLEATPEGNWSIPMYGTQENRYYAEHLNTVKKTGRR